MGTDIGWCLEIKTPTGWVGLTSGLGGKQLANKRNYRFFNELAGVRADELNNYPKPLGFPDDMSSLSVFLADRGYLGFHDHSWCSLEDFVVAYNRAAKSYDPPEATSNALELLDFTYWQFKLHDEFRVLFAFGS